MTAAARVDPLHAALAAVRARRRRVVGAGCALGLLTGFGAGTALMLLARMAGTGVVEGHVLATLELALWGGTTAAFAHVGTRAGEHVVTRRLPRWLTEIHRAHGVAPHLVLELLAPHERP